MRRKTYIWLLLVLCLLLGACSQSEKTPKTADYGFTLTQEQVENYASAVSYLIKREGEDIYRIQYSNCGVTRNGNRLLTKYNGMAISVSDGLGQQCFPVLNLGGMDSGQMVGVVSLRDGTYKNNGRYWYLVSIAQESTPKLVTLADTEQTTEEQMLLDDPLPMPDLSAYGIMLFNDGQYYNLTYDQRGRLLPVAEWNRDTPFSAVEFYIADQPLVSYVPLVGGEYYILYEITDRQGNVYCSDLIPYKTEPQKPQPQLQPDASAKWESGAREQLVLEEELFDLYLSVEKGFLGKSYYSFKAKNKSQSPLTVKVVDGFANGNVAIGTNDTVEVPPGKFVASSMGVSFGIADGAPELEELKSLEFTVYALDAEALKTVCLPKKVWVDMTQAWPIENQSAKYFQITQPAYDALAGEQVLLQTEDIRITLVGAGQYDPQLDGMAMVFKMENLGQHTQKISIDGLAINGIYKNASEQESLPGGSVLYTKTTVSQSDLTKLGQTSIETLDVLFSIEDSVDWAFPSKQRHWLSVGLTQKGTATALEQGTILWEQDGVKVDLRTYDAEQEKWLLTLTNETDENLKLAVLNPDTGEKIGFTTAVGGKQQAVFEIDAPKDANEYAIAFQLLDFTGYTPLTEVSNSVILRID